MNVFLYFILALLTKREQFTNTLSLPCTHVQLLVLSKYKDHVKVLECKLSSSPNAYSLLK